ncbi:MAG: hypothetical protein IPH53_22915 [Flavobacteriales bacterium]|nr:hypothetical protein [Flavobacteriales bacterium]
MAERWWWIQWTRIHFPLAERVFFHDDPCFPDGKGRELKAADVEFAFTQLCTASDINPSFWLFQDLVLGANEYHAATQEVIGPESVEGIKVLDDHTVRVTLVHRSANFPAHSGTSGLLDIPEGGLDGILQWIADTCHWHGAVQTEGIQGG